MRLVINHTTYPLISIVFFLATGYSISDNLWCKNDPCKASNFREHQVVLATQVPAMIEPPTNIYGLGIANVKWEDVKWFPKEVTTPRCHQCIILRDQDYLGALLSIP